MGVYLDLGPTEINDIARLGPMILFSIVEFKNAAWIGWSCPVHPRLLAKFIVANIIPIGLI